MGEETFGQQFWNLVGSHCWIVKEEDDSAKQKQPPSLVSLFPVVQRVRGVEPIVITNKSRESKKGAASPLEKFRDSVRGRCAPYSFILLSVAAWLVGLFKGFAKLHPDTQCPTMLALIAVVRLDAPAYT